MRLFPDTFKQYKTAQMSQAFSWKTYKLRKSNDTT